MSEETKGRAIPALWFNHKGCGPDHFMLEVQPLKALKDGDELVCPPSLGIRVRCGELVILGGDMVDGEFNLHREQVEELHRQLGEWIASDISR